MAPLASECSRVGGGGGGSSPWREQTSSSCCRTVCASYQTKKKNNKDFKINLSFPITKTWKLFSATLITEKKHRMYGDKWEGGGRNNRLQCIGHYIRITKLPRPKSRVDQSPGSTRPQGRPNPRVDQSPGSTKAQGRPKPRVDQSPGSTKPQGSNFKNDAFRFRNPSREMLFFRFLKMVLEWRFFSPFSNMVTLVKRLFVALRSTLIHEVTTDQWAHLPVNDAGSEKWAETSDNLSVLTSENPPPPLGKMTGWYTVPGGPG